MHIDWPTQGQAALLVSGVGLMGYSGPQTPVPIASVTKMMTAYLVLKQHPLPVGQDGPTVTISQADYQVYLHDKATGQSLAKVAVGEKLTERQLLEAMLLPSANNVAYVLAKWTAGSEQAFVAEMNATAAKLGMKNTHYVDASGVNPQTVSTAVDQVKIAEKVMAIPAFRHTVAMRQVTLPVAGTVYNVDYALGKDGIIGIKTGSTNEAGGCFAFATAHNVGGKQVLLLGVVLGQQPNNSMNSELMVALSEGRSLSKEAAKYLEPVQVVTPGTVIGQASAPWAAKTSAVVDSPATVIGWPGMSIQTKLAPSPMGKTEASGAKVGQLDIQAGEQTVTLPVQLSAAIGRPSLGWRLKRIPFVH